jgi:hypothetical protein
MAALDAFMNTAPRSIRNPDIEAKDTNIVHKIEQARTFHPPLFSPCHE